MLEKTYTITLSDGNSIGDLTLNGTNFVSKAKVTEAMFANNCSPVIISNGETQELHENMSLVQILETPDGEYWFVLRDISQEELGVMKLQSDIEYVAMMSGVEL